MKEPSPAPLDLAIVIVNYNTAALLRDCLWSVFASRGGLTLAVCVVDNASPDESVSLTRAEFPQVHVITNRDNVGYSRANNQGLRHFGFSEPGSSDTELATLPRYALLLNPDTVLPADALAGMVAFLDAHPAAGVAGPRLVRQDGSLDKACRRSFPTPQTSLWHMLWLDRLFPKNPRFGRYNLTYLDPAKTARADAVVGAFMLVRREAIVQAGLLDEAFWMYGEDLDWAKRITDAGWQVWYNAAVTVVHIKEAASQHSYRARVEFYRAMTVFYEKHYRATTPFWLDVLVRGGIWFFGGLDLLRRRLQGRARAAHAKVPVGAAQ